jgi:hypothetical protein
MRTGSIIHEKNKLYRNKRSNGLSTKHTHKTKDRVKTRGDSFLKCIFALSAAHTDVD